MHAQVERLPDRCELDHGGIGVVGVVHSVIERKRPIPVFFAAEDEIEQSVPELIVACGHHHTSSSQSSIP